MSGDVRRSIVVQESKEGVWSAALPDEFSIRDVRNISRMLELTMRTQHLARQQKAALAAEKAQSAKAKETTNG